MGLSLRLHSLNMWWGLRVCFCNKVPDDSDTGALYEPHFKVQWLSFLQASVDGHIKEKQNIWWFYQGRKLLIHFLRSSLWKEEANYINSSLTSYNLKLPKPRLPKFYHCERYEGWGASQWFPSALHIVDTWKVCVHDMNGSSIFFL